MNEQQATPNEQATQPKNISIPLSTESPDSPAGFAGAAGIPVVSKDHPPDNQTEYQAILPGLEEHFPKGPLELDYSTRSLTPEARALIDKWDNEKASKKGAVINLYPSGEMTAGFYRTGRRSMPSRRERVVSQEFTRQARKTIRRAVESGITSFKLFITLTFDPKQAKLDESGRVDQAWAKKAFKRFLNTVKKKYDRRLGKTGKGGQE
jgi:hypothetical protein